MALLADEQFSGGQVRDINGRTVVTTDTLGAALGAGEQVSGGRVRDADGRMVVAVETASATLSAGERWCDGEVRDSQGRLVVVVDTLNAALAAGEQFSGGHVRDAAGRRVVASDTGAVTLLAGEQYSGGQVRDSVGRMVVRGAGGGGGPRLLVGDASTTYSIADSSGNNGANYAQFTALLSGTVDTVWLRTNATVNTCTYVAFGVYADNVGVPGVMLGAVSVSAVPPISSWISGAGLSVAVSAGTVYWLAFYNTGGTLNFNDAVASGGTTQKWTSGATGLVSNPTISGTAQGGPIGIRATGP